MDFVGFPKVPRLSRQVVVTEKIDGTNASVFIQKLTQTEDGSSALVLPEDQATMVATCYAPDGSAYGIWAGSRTRWVTPKSDNYGFAAWVEDHHLELAGLGPGHHFGEWWGKDIQRNYGLNERRFSLFNVSRWLDGWVKAQPKEGQSYAPACCSVVPVLAELPFFDSIAIDFVLDGLNAMGSVAAPGFKEAEGIMVYHSAANMLFKKTIRGDVEGKHAEAHPPKPPKPPRVKNPAAGGRRKEQVEIAFQDRRQPHAAYAQRVA